MYTITVNNSKERKKERHSPNSLKKKSLNFTRSFVRLNFMNFVNCFFWQILNYLDLFIMSSYVMPRFKLQLQILSTELFFSAFPFPSHPQSFFSPSNRSNLASVLWLFHITCALFAAEALHDGGSVAPTKLHLDHYSKMTRSRRTLRRDVFSLCLSISPLFLLHSDLSDILSSSSRTPRFPLLPLSISCTLLQMC